MPPNNDRLSFATPTSATLQLHVVRPDDLGTFAQGDGQPWAGWLASTGFEASLGEVRLLPGTDGAIAGAVVGLGTDMARRRLRFGLAKCVAALPGGDWALTGPLSPADQTEAALGWLLAGYRFGRYRPGIKVPPMARLVCPAGVDADRVLAMAEGQTRRARGGTFTPGR